MKNFKAQLDLIESGKILIFGFILLIILVIVLSAIYSGFSGITVAQNVIGKGLNSISILGDGLIFIYLMMNLIAVFSAFYTNSHPMFTVISILGLIITWIITYAFISIFSNIMAITFMYQIFITYFPYGKFMILALPVFTLLFSFLIIIALNGKESDI